VLVKEEEKRHETKPEEREHATHDTWRAVALVCSHDFQAPRNGLAHGEVGKPVSRGRADHEHRARRCERVESSLDNLLSSHCVDGKVESFSASDLGQSLLHILRGRADSVRRAKGARLFELPRLDIDGDERLGRVERGGHDRRYTDATGPEYRNCGSRLRFEDVSDRRWSAGCIVHSTTQLG
jgi:hypothetical protein